MRGTAAVDSPAGTLAVLLLLVQSATEQEVRDEIEYFEPDARGTFGWPT
jgi:hypothetical protein